VKTKFAICLGLAAAGFAALPLAASAQALLPPYEIATSMQSMGLQPISMPKQRGTRYVLRAIDRQGMKVRVVADGVSGQILRVRPVDSDRDRPYAERSYPYHSNGMPPPRGGYDQRQGSYEQPANPQAQGNQPRSYQRQGSNQGGYYDQQGSYEQQGGYQRQPPMNPGDPSVIYAPHDKAAVPRAAVGTPTAAKPPAPKVAAKLPSKPPVSTGAPADTPAEVSKIEGPSAATNGADVSSSAVSAEKNPALTAPPVQAFD
jgi:hypothetical protein